MLGTNVQFGRLRIKSHVFSMRYEKYIILKFRGLYEVCIKKRPGTFTLQIIFYLILKSPFPDSEWSQRHSVPSHPWLRAGRRHF